MHTIDLVNLAFSKLNAIGVELRFVRGDGLSSGLCRIAQRKILFLNDSTSASEQLDVIAQAFAILEYDLSQLPKPLRVEIEDRMSVVTKLTNAAA